jgi:hypothetical protein
MSAKYENGVTNSNSIIYYSENKKKKRRIIKRYISVIIVLIVILSSVSIAYAAGYIPITAFLEIKKPIGNAVELNVDMFAKFYPKISNNPEIDKFKYSIYGTDASYSAIMQDYEKRLSIEGYSLEYNGDERINGLKARNYGYVKGFTGVGIVVISNARPLFGHVTIVLYSTGSVFDYKDILDKYGGLSGLLA